MSTLFGRGDVRMSKDLRTFLQDLVRSRPGDLQRVDSIVSPTFGITAFGARSAQTNTHAAFFFTAVEGSSLPCVTNLLATHERVAVALGCDVEELRTSSEVLNRQRKHPPVEVARSAAPVKEVVLRGEDVDLARLPIPVHNELDGGPFLTAGVTVLRDPVSGAINAGIYRHHVYDSQHMGVWFFGSHHGGVIYRRYAERGEPAPIAIVIGHHPAFLMGAVSRVAGIGGEYDAAGAFLDESLEVVKAETSDLLVPARAEIILEGVILPDAEREEGPFAEWPGHYVGGGPKPVIRVDCIAMRGDAIFQDIQASGQEHRLIGALPRIASIHGRVKEVVAGLRAVNVPVHARMNCYLSIHKQHANDAIRAGFAALNTEPENLRMVVVVDDDIDVYDDRDVAWAIGTRFNAPDDLLVIPGFSGPGGLLPTNWSYDVRGNRSPQRSSAMILDATKPAPPVEFPVRARVPLAEVDAVDLSQAIPINDETSLPWLSSR